VAAASDYNTFGKLVINPETREISDEIIVILNDNLIQHQDIPKIELNNGDVVKLALMFIGG
jgi:hypothetical protein